MIINKLRFNVNNKKGKWYSWKPRIFQEMKLVAAKKLSSGMPHVRVDLYGINGKVYFGELTFYDSSGLDNHNSNVVNLEWGS